MRSVPSTKMSSAGDKKLGSGDGKISDYGCVLTAYYRIAQALGYAGSLADANDEAIRLKLFSGEKGNMLTIENGVALINALVKDPSKHIVYEGSVYGTLRDMASAINEKEYSSMQFFGTVRISTHNLNKKWFFDHTMNINENSVFVSEDITDIDNSIGFYYNDTSEASRSGTNDKSRKK